MSAAQVRKETLKQLRAARVGMMSARWTLALEKQDKKTRAKSAKEFLRVHHAIQKLENEQLAKIRDKLLQNEAALARGADRLSGALQNLKQVKTVLKAVTGFLEIVARILPLLAMV